MIQKKYFNRYYAKEDNFPIISIIVLKVPG